MRSKGNSRIVTVTLVTAARKTVFNASLPPVSPVSHARMLSFLCKLVSAVLLLATLQALESQLFGATLPVSIRREMKQRAPAVCPVYEFVFKQGPSNKRATPQLR